MGTNIDKTQGYVLFWRSIMDSVVFKNPKMWRVYSWCLFRANYTVKEELPGLHKVNLVPGQFITSTRHAAEALDISVTTLYEYLHLLEFEHIIERTSTSKYTVITIQNWNELQHPERTGEHKLDTENTYKTKEAAALERLAFLLRGKFKIEGSLPYRKTQSGWTLIHDPIAYLASMRAEASLNTIPVKDMTNEELLTTLQGKRLGYDAIPSDVFDEAVDRGIYHE